MSLGVVRFTWEREKIKGDIQTTPQIHTWVGGIIVTAGVMRTFVLHMKSQWKTYAIHTAGGFVQHILGSVISDIYN